MQGATGSAKKRRRLIFLRDEGIIQLYELASVQQCDGHTVGAGAHDSPPICRIRVVIRGVEGAAPYVPIFPGQFQYNKGGSFYEAEL